MVCKHLILPVLTLKRTCLCGCSCTKNACEIKGFWPLSLQPAELYYVSWYFYAEWKTVFQVLYI